jgi:hypothetical protein
MAGEYAGRSTTDIEQYIRWMKSSLGTSDDHDQQIRDIVSAHAEIDRVTDEAAAKFAPEEEETPVGTGFTIDEEGNIVTSGQEEEPLDTGAAGVVD